MTTTKRRTVTHARQNRALAIIADYLGPAMGYDGPAPTGQDAAHTAQGPMLIRDWDWPSSGPTPTVILEGGPHDWAVQASMDPTVLAKMRALGVFCEPYSGWALCLHVA